MAMDIDKVERSEMETEVPDYAVGAVQTEGATGQDETEWMNVKWTQQLGYYKKIPELQKAINALALWTVGKGYTADPGTEVILTRITGWGEDTFLSILNNMMVVKKIGGDAYAEIVRNEAGTLTNILPFDPGSIKIIVDKQGVIKRYEQVNKINKKEKKIFQPEQILHFCNDRVADEIHGTSVIDACEWVILARNEAMDDWKTVLHRNVNPLKIFHLDTDNTTKIKNFRKKYEKVIKDKEVLFVPKGNVEVEFPAANLQDSLATIKYYENFFYQAVGIPKIILGGSEEFTEASSKIGYLTFEQIYAREQKEIQADLWNQVAIKIEFIAPASLKNELLSDEKKDKESGAVKPSDVTAGVGE